MAVNVLGGVLWQSTPPMEQLLPSGYHNRAFNWVKRVCRLQNENQKAKTRAAIANQPFSSLEMNWNAVMFAVLSVTYLVLLLILLTPWMRHYLRPPAEKPTESKSKTSSREVVHSEEASNQDKTPSDSDDSSLNISITIDPPEQKAKNHSLDLEGQLRKKIFSLTKQEMADLSSFEIDSAVLEVKERIGYGAFADVHLSIFRGTPVAVKILRNSDRESVMRFKQELLLMKSLSHPNIVQLYGPCWNSGKFMIVTELFTYGNLADVLENPDLDLTWPKDKYYMICDIARGMAYLHGVKYYDYTTKTYKDCIVHRDLKPQNMLVTEGLHIKISDFGEARALDTDYTMTRVGTLLYIAPEIVRGETYDEKCDVYSFGVILFAMLISKGTRVFQVFAEELERRKNAEKLLAPLPENGSVESPVPKSSETGENSSVGGERPSIGRRKHTPHVVTEAIVNDDLRPQLPKGALSSLSLLTRQAWDPDPNKHPEFTAILSYIESVVNDEVMYGVPVTGDDFTDSPLQSSPGPSSMVKTTKSTLNSADGGMYGFGTDGPPSADDTLRGRSGTGDSMHIEHILQRSRGIYPPTTANNTSSSSDVYRPTTTNPSTYSNMSVTNRRFLEKHDARGPFAVPSAAACRRHRRKVHDRPG